MFRTCEMRWFFPSAPPEILADGHATLLPARTDWYATPTNPACGVKVREGRLEPKLLLNDNGVHDVGSASGRMQYWGKWSLDFPDQDNPTDELLAATDWIPVEKRRSLWSFRCDGDRVVALDSQADAQCQIEWTRLMIHQTPWWTIGVEAFDGDQLDRILLRVARHVLQGLGDSSSFVEENSYSYPAWLCGLRSD